MFSFGSLATVMVFFTVPIVFFILILAVAKRYKKVGPNHVMIISGRRHRVRSREGDEVTGYRSPLAGPRPSPRLPTADRRRCAPAHHVRTPPAPRRHASRPNQKLASANVSCRSRPPPLAQFNRARRRSACLKAIRAH